MERQSGETGTGRQKSNDSVWALSETGVGLEKQVVMGGELKGFNAGTIAAGHVLKETNKRRKAGKVYGLEKSED